MSASRTLLRKQHRAVASKIGKKGAPDRRVLTVKVERVIAPIGSTPLKQALSFNRRATNYVLDSVVRETTYHVTKGHRSWLRQE